MGSYWDLPHPGVASEWKGPDDKPDQAAPKSTGNDESKGPGDTPDQAATDIAGNDEKPLDESSTIADADDVIATAAAAVDVEVSSDTAGSIKSSIIEDEDVNTSAAAVDIEVASDTADSIEVVVAEAEPTTEHSSPTDSPRRVSDIVDVPVEGSADNSVDEIPIDYHSADASEVSKQSVKEADGTGSAVNWLLQDDTVPANVKAADDSRDGSIEVHVHQDLL